MGAVPMGCENNKTTGSVVREVAARKNLRGFTLIEIIVVIAIIAILASIMSIAMSIYVRESRIDDANAQAYVVYSTVQDWLIDMEVKNVDLSRFCANGATEGADNDLYFEIASRNTVESPTAGGNLTVSLNSADPFGSPTFLNEADIASSSVATARTGTDFGDNAPIIIEWLGKLGNSFPTGFDGNWRAVINADDYSVFLTYWQDGQIGEAEGSPSASPSGYRIFDKTKTSQNQYLFPNKAMGSSDGYGFSMGQQQNNVIASNTNLYGQYPFGPIKP
jgi:prepilin-type N-terminal cleavage/methylation domain-containing protein